MNTVDVINRSFVAPFTGLDPNENYDIRRVLEKATSTGVPIEVGNETLISNVLNVYTDANVDGFGENACIYRKNWHDNAMPVLKYITCIASNH